MSKELDTIKCLLEQCPNESIKKDLLEIEKKLEQAQKDKEMLNIFKNALTVERDIPPELEIKESEKGCSYVFKEAVKIHENRIEEMLKKSLREWVFKNAFPKELKALEIIKNEFEIDFNDKKQEITLQSVEKPYTHIRFSLTREIKDQDKYNLLKEVLL